MIYQIFYDRNSARCIVSRNVLIKPLGVYIARELKCIPGCIYDDEKLPNLTKHNTLCEWRALYYIWRHHPSSWVGFTSWQHDRKKFAPSIALIDESWIHSSLKKHPIAGFAIWPLRSLIIKELRKRLDISLKNQFIQWKIYEEINRVHLNDSRKKALGKYHHLSYWEFVMQEFKCLHGVDLEKELDWDFLAGVDILHTWCNAFIAEWNYFDGYMKMFSPIVFSMLLHFGSHPRDLELAYICERLIILYNYIQYTKDPNLFGEMDNLA